VRTLHQTHYGWDNSIPPIAEIASGDELDFEIGEASGGQIVKASQVGALASLDFAKINAVTGPVFVKGAEPGDVLEAEIRAIDGADWGWTAIIPGFGLLHEEYPEPWLQIWDVGKDVATGIPGVAIPVRRFPGTIGVALAEPGAHSIVPPRENGGNMDIRHLTKGVKVYLPVWVKGALFSAGDPHAAQGDGEVCGVAIESPATIALRFRLIKGYSIDEPQYEVPAASALQPDRAGYHVTTGICDDLHEAARKSVRSMIAHLMRERGYDRSEAYTLCSVAVDLKISEIVDSPNWCVSAFLPRSIFTS
jgi:formamidase